MFHRSDNCKEFNLFSTRLVLNATKHSLQCFILLNFVMSCKQLTHCSPKAFLLIAASSFEKYTKLCLDTRSENSKKLNSTYIKKIL